MDEEEGDAPFVAMQVLPAQNPIPREFRLRFIESRILMFVPAFAAVVAMCWFGNPKFFPVMLAGKVFLLIFIAGLASRQAKRQWDVIEHFSKLDVEPWEILEPTNSNILPLFGSVAIIGTIISIARQDARYILLVAAIAGLIAVGLLLRWMVFDNWIRGKSFPEVSSEQP